MAYYFVVDKFYIYLYVHNNNNNIKSKIIINTSNYAQFWSQIVASILYIYIYIYKIGTEK